MTEGQERLVEEGLELTDRLVRMYLARHPPYLDGDAIRGAANEGLVKAALHYDPRFGAAFKSYVWERVTGAMLDETRRVLPGHRTTRAEHVPLEDWDALDEHHVDRACNVIDLRAALASLDRRHRHVVVASLAGVSLLELADELGVSDSRVCQLKKQGLSACKARMAA